MAKKKKKNVYMVDMSARLKLKTYSATQEEIITLQRELEEIEKSVAKRMLLYEENLKDMISSIANEGFIVQEGKDSTYFIEKYEDLVKNRNFDNIAGRLQQYESYLKKLKD